MYAMNVDLIEIDGTHGIALPARRHQVSPEQKRSTIDSTTVGQRPKGASMVGDTRQQDYIIHQGGSASSRRSGEHWEKGSKYINSYASTYEVYHVGDDYYFYNSPCVSLLQLFV